MNRCQVLFKFSIFIIKFFRCMQIPDTLYNTFNPAIGFIKILLPYTVNLYRTSRKFVINRFCAAKEIYTCFFIFQSKRSLNSNPRISSIDISKIAYYNSIFYSHRVLWLFRIKFSPFLFNKVSHFYYIQFRRKSLCIFSAAFFIYLHIIQP